MAYIFKVIFCPVLFLSIHNEKDAKLTIFSNLLQFVSLTYLFECRSDPRGAGASGTRTARRSPRRSRAALPQGEARYSAARRSPRAADTVISRHAPAKRTRFVI